MSSLFLGDPPRDNPGARWSIEDQVAARHEAAHALAALAAHMELHHVNLRECVALRGPATPRGVALFALAGGIAAGSLGGVRSDADHAVLKDAAAEASDPRGGFAWIVERTVDAREFVRKHESDICRLAVVLLERRTLTGEQVLGVLPEHWRPRRVQPVRLAP